MKGKVQSSIASAMSVVLVSQNTRLAVICLLSLICNECAFPRLLLSSTLRLARHRDGLNAA